MSKFQELNPNLRKVLEHLISSQRLCKYLVYDTLDPVSQPDVQHPDELLYERISPVPRNPPVEAEPHSYITVMFDQFNPGGTYAVKEGALTLFVISHVSLWRLNEGIRPLAVMHEIDRLLNQRQVIGLNPAKFDQAKWIAVNDNFSGYQLSYKIAFAN
ncbi:hypothetical protein PAE9249_01011 [Paenibacillus sp. CECT 9249]|uniref:hypothetical protein n=1 Tax=Paenibacillus sp. CECT 9249 TaxID=2845385 RepID=UPI001E510FA8|nr:hypothetical protein [Paenibacillus sp. CECT 9249]CAH0118522.1 hypothetical protein PAE9249_01011 [Paenibacillus sp. CECT 9249]